MCNWGTLLRGPISRPGVSCSMTLMSTDGHVSRSCLWPSSRSAFHAILFSCVMAMRKVASRNSRLSVRVRNMACIRIVNIHFSHGVLLFCMTYVKMSRCTKSPCGIHNVTSHSVCGVSLRLGRVSLDRYLFLRNWSPLSGPGSMLFVHTNASSS